MKMPPVRNRPWRSVPIPDRFLLCPGSGVVHDTVFLPVMQGPKVRFIRCPLTGCKLKAFLPGEAWTSKSVGITRRQVARHAPGALIL